MPILKSLTFTAMPKTSANPTVSRRAKLIARLEEQRSLAQDPNYLRVNRRWKKEGDEKQLVETKQRVRPWWRTDATGATVLSIRYGLKAVELEKGKPGIVVQSKEKLVSVINTVIEATRAGELDDLLALQGIGRGVPKAKRAA